MANWRELVLTIIDSQTDPLNNLSKEIWSKPENGFEEFHAHTVLTNFLSEEGFQVERSYHHPTGFRAVYNINTSVEGATAGGDADCDAKADEGLHVCFICEYDAVLGVGHASGHNLSSEASIAAAIAIKKCLKEKVFPGKVTVLGTPAEDCGGGSKIDMLKAGAFVGVNFALMLSPLNTHIVYPKHYTLITVKVTYKGKAAHASAYAWEGRNALDAAVACYNNIALLRQQCKPTWSINGIITQGGAQPNIIPDKAELSFWLRAPDYTDLVFLQQKCTACFVAAAKATGCEAEFEFEERSYFPMQHSTKLGELYKEHAESLGFSFSHDLAQQYTGSTDMGNVSQCVPCLSPAYDIGTRHVKNSIGFHEDAGSTEAHAQTLIAAKALALTAAQMLAQPEILDTVKEEYDVIHTSSSESMLRKKILPEYD